MDGQLQFNQGFEAFLEKRQEGDMDLVEIVRSELLKYGLKENVEAFFDTDGYIVQAKQKRPEIQRYLLNVYLHLQLMMAKRSSLETRYYLLPNGELDVWITIFKNKIAPFMAHEHLPQQIV